MVMSDRQKSMPVAVIPCKLWNHTAIFNEHERVVYMFTVTDTNGAIWNQWGKWKL